MMFTTDKSFTLQACIKEGKFIVCDQISPAPDGQLLLDYIRNTKFTSRRSGPLHPASYITG